jgi:hypothetical protein
VIISDLDLTIKTMIHYQDDEFLLTASSIEATFSDGATLSLTNITIRPSTPIGDELIISTGDDSSNSRGVRLILISPERDWRRNQTYAWKLDNAWMSDPTADWLHWNVESYINSAIQVPQENNVFACALLEFHFSPIGLKHHYDPVVTNSKVVLRDVKIGAHFSSAPQKPYSPCADGCSVIDGTVTSAFGSATSDGTYWKVGVVLGAILIILGFSSCWCRRRRADLYDKLSPEEDLNLTVEDTYMSTAPRSTVQDTVNKT